MIAIGKTSNEVKNGWKQRNYKQYNVNLRKDADGELIKLVELKKAQGTSTTDIFREALEKLKNEG